MSGTLISLLVMSVPFLEIAFSKVPSLYCKATAQPSILGSINNLVSANNPFKNSSIESFSNEGKTSLFFFLK